MSCLIPTGDGVLDDGDNFSFTVHHIFQTSNCLFRPFVVRIAFQQQQMSHVMASWSHAGAGGLLSLRPPKMCMNNNPTNSPFRTIGFRLHVALR
uniref:HV80H14.10A n=1 Tax=Hordeum vulgare TaxID=4513 RepID=Q8L4H5_HORVU|nr:HV80H14.10B [Hordeum vulgare subsp. vulgare]AAM22824.1 HV80H14.10A [Hordeum vulgare subsp. vulgare]